MLFHARRPRLNAWWALMATAIALCVVAAVVLLDVAQPPPHPPVPPPAADRPQADD